MEDLQRVSPGLSGFLQEFLKLPPDRLPALLCTECHDSSTRAREFRAQCGLLASKQDFLQQIGQEEIASMVSGFLPAAKKSKNFCLCSVVQKYFLLRSAWKEEKKT